MSDISDKIENTDADINAGPHAWIQWRGTDVCADIHCSCGEMTHIYASFTYYVRFECCVRCCKCNKVYAMCQNIRMIEVSDNEIVGRSVIDTLDDDDV